MPSNVNTDGEKDSFVAAPDATMDIEKVDEVRSSLNLAPYVPKTTH